MLHVYIGRFAPLHEGHMMLIRKMIKKFGIKNCLVLIGSTNVRDDRTPFTFESRLKMLQSKFPDIKILPFPDVGDDEVWLDNMQNLERNLGQKFIFYGGSEQDLKILSQRFETHVLVDRYKEGRGISATEIRKKMRESGELT